MSDHAQRRFAERIDDTIDPEVGLRLLLDEVLAVPGQVHLRGGVIVHKQSVQDVTVVITAGFGTVLTVYRAAEHPRRERWRVPVACAA